VAEATETITTKPLTTKSRRYEFLSGSRLAVPDDQKGHRQRFFMDELMDISLV
jgi:hypothetical protein